MSRKIRVRLVYALGAVAIGVLVGLVWHAVLLVTGLKVDKWPISSIVVGFLSGWNYLVFNARHWL